MEEWEGDDTFRLVMPTAKHEPIAFLATAGLDSLVYFGVAMGAPASLLAAGSLPCQLRPAVEQLCSL